MKKILIFLPLFILLSPAAFGQSNPETGKEQPDPYLLMDELFRGLDSLFRESFSEFRFQKDTFFFREFGPESLPEQGLLFGERETGLLMHELLEELQNRIRELEGEIPEWFGEESPDHPKNTDRKPKRPTSTL